MSLQIDHQTQLSAYACLSVKFLLIKREEKWENGYLEVLALTCDGVDDIVRVTVIIRRKDCGDKRPRGDVLV